MLHIKNHKQGHLFDPWEHLGPKRRERINSSWAGVFREHILLALPVDSFARCFKTGTGRPTKELYMSLRALILQQMHDFTDEETVDQLAFNIKWHYALDVTGETDEITYMMCLKTLLDIRRLVIKGRLEENLFQRTTEVLARAFSADTSSQRLDSVHVRSNMRHLRRICIFSKSIHKFLVNLKRQQEPLYSQLEKKQGELIDRYFTQKAISCFSLVKPSASEKTLAVVSRDLLALVQRFRDVSSVRSLFQLSEKGTVGARPGGHVPIRSPIRERLSWLRQTAWRVSAGVGMDAIETVRSRGGCRSFMSQGGLPTYAR